MLHNAQVQRVETNAVIEVRTVVMCAKKQQHCLRGELAVGDCWIGLTLAKSSGLILTGRVGKRTDDLSEELFISTARLD